MLLYILQQKHIMKMSLYGFHNSCEKKIEISYPYKPIPEKGLEHFKQEQSMNYLKKIKFLTFFM